MAEQHTCNACNVSFRTREEVTKHNAEVHDMQMEKKQCMKCDVSFYTDEALQEHMKKAHMGS